MKRTAAFIIAVLFILACASVYAFAVKVDGICSTAEWSGSSAVSLKSQKSFNNEIINSVVRTVYDDYKECLYISVMTSYKGSGSEDNAGVKLRVNSGEPMLVKLDGSAESAGRYDIETASEYDAASACSVTEIALYFLDGIEYGDEIMLNIYDLNGKESVMFTLEPYQKPPQSEGQEERPSGTDKKSDKSSSSKTAKKSTTKKSTTKKTTKAKTTKKSESKSSSKAGSKKGNNVEGLSKVDKSGTSAESESQKDKKSGSAGSTRKQNAENSDFQSAEVIEKGGSSNGQKYGFIAVGTVCAAALSFAVIAVTLKHKEGEE